jgi:hypothetical protein
MKRRDHLGDPGEDNIKMDLREVGSENVNLVKMAKNMVHWRASANTVKSLWIPQNRKLLDKLTNYQLFNESRTPWS